MSIEHTTIADPYIHEPKGVSTAAAGSVYLANGTGSGSWTTQYIPAAVEIYFDIHTNGSGYVVCPFAGTIKTIYCVSDAATTTGATALSFAIGGVSITGASMSIASGVAAGTVTTSTPSSNNVIAVGNVLSVTSNGTTGACPSRIIALISPRTA